MSPPEPETLGRRPSGRSTTPPLKAGRPTSSQSGFRSLPSTPGTPGDSRRRTTVSGSRAETPERRERPDRANRRPPKPKRNAYVREDGPALIEYNQYHYLEQDKPLFTDKRWFVTLVGIITVSNVAALAASMDLKCSGKNCPGGFDDGLWVLLDNIFTVLFVIEMVVRIWAGGPSRYFKGDPFESKMGVDVFASVDLFIVFLRVVDVWMLAPAGINSSLKIISAFRIVHIAIVAKKMRAVGSLRELWLLLAGVKDTFKTLLYVAVMMLLVTWVFAIWITTALRNDTVDTFDFSRSAWKWNMKDYWGTVPKSMYSLFQVMTRDEWAVSLTRPLVLQRPWMVIIFIMFFCITNLALMNTIVGVVVESTLSSSKANEEREGKEKQKVDMQVLDSLLHIFREADSDGSGELDREELKAALRRPNVKDRMRVLEIPYRDLDLLFTLLDTEGSGLIRTDMFFRGCSKLRGLAMASDLHHFSVDLERQTMWATYCAEKMLKVNDLLAEVVDTVDSVDVEIMQSDTDEKDPVLMARRQRQRPPKSAMLRGEIASGGEHTLMHLGSKFGTRSFEDQREASKRSNYSAWRDSIRRSASFLDDVVDPEEPLALQPDVAPPPLPDGVRVRLPGVVDAGADSSALALSSY